VTQLFNYVIMEKLLLDLLDGKEVKMSLKESILNNLPSSILNSKCFKDPIKGMWRYEYGLPLDKLDNKKMAYGTHMWLKVEILVDVLILAHKYLNQDQLHQYMKKIEDVSRHRDFLFEFAPLMRLDDDIKVTYEPPGYCNNCTLIDWLVEKKDNPPILLEVKNRIGDLALLLGSIQEGQSIAQPPEHDVSILFSSIEKKFRSCAASNMLQGAWIGTQLRQEKQELIAEYRKIDTSKIHFIVLGDHLNDVLVMASTEDVKKQVLITFKCIESERFVFTR